MLASKMQYMHITRIKMHEKYTLGGSNIHTTVYMHEVYIADIIQEETLILHASDLYIACIIDDACIPHA